MSLDKSSEKKQRKLTPKQEKFVEGIVSGKNPSEAYREAYDVSNSSKESIKVNAQKLLADTNISLTIDTIRKEQQKQINYTVEDNFKELDIGAKAAMSEGNFSAYIKAIELKGKLLGFYTDKKEIDVGIKAIQVVFDGKCKGL